MMESTQIGRYESWIEEGTLGLYYHEFGRPLGFSARMTPEETMQLLNWLSAHHEEISKAVRAHARQTERSQTRIW
jgi:hypothetical protein